MSCIQTNYKWQKNRNEIGKSDRIQCVSINLCLFSCISNGCHEKCMSLGKLMATDEENAFKYNHNVCRMKKGILFTYHPINNNNNNICNLWNANNHANLRNIIKF